MSDTILLDTGPLFAFLAQADAHHDWAVEQWRSLAAPLLTCEPVIAETVFLLQRQRKPVHGVFELLERKVVRLELSVAEELKAVCALVTRYDNVPMSLADACLVRMSELWADSRVFTLDEDFRVYRRHGRQAIPLIFPQ